MKTKHTLLLPFLTIAILLSGCSFKDHSTEEHLQNARAYAEGGYNAAASMELKKVLSSEPGHIQSLLLLDKVTTEPNKNRKMFPYLQRAKDAGVDNKKIRYRLAQAYLDRNQFQDALTQIQSLTEIISAPKSLEKLQFLKAKVLSAKGNYKDAEDIYQILTKDPEQETNAKIGLAEILILKVTDQFPYHPSYSNIHLPGDQFLLSSSKKSHSTKLTKEINDYLQQAKEYLDQIIKIQPDNIDANLKLAELYYLKSHYSQSIDYANRVLSIDQKNTTSLLVLAKSNISLGYFQAAKHSLIQLLAIDKYYLLARNTLAAYYLSQGNFKASDELLKPYLNKGVIDEDLFINSGISELIKKDSQKSLNYFKQATANFPKSAYAYAQLGTTYLNNQQYKLALKAFKTARSNEPSNFKINLSLIQTVLLSGKQTYGLKISEILARENPESPIPLHIQGRIYEHQNKNKKSKSMYQKALSIESSFSPSRVQLSRLIFDPIESGKLLKEGLNNSRNQLDLSIEIALLEDKVGNHQAAIDHLKYIISENPYAIDPQVSLGKIYLQQGNYKEVSRIKNKLLDLKSPPENVLLFIYDLYQTIGNITKSIIIAKKLYERFPANPEYITLLASSYAGNGDYRNAKKFYQQTLSLLGENYIPALSGLANLEIQHGNIELPKKYIKTILKNSPDKTEGYLLYGDILMAENNYLKAINIYQRALKKDNSPNIIKKLSVVYLYSDQKQNAIKFLDKWSKIFPENIEVSMTYINYYQQIGNNKKALSETDRFLLIQPDNVLMLAKSAELYKSKDKNKAWEMIQKAHRITSEGPEILNVYGKMCIERKRFGEGLDALQMAVLASPTTLSYQYHFAEALNQSGQINPAKKLLKSALSKNSLFAERDQAVKLLAEIGPNFFN